MVHVVYKCNKVKKYFSKNRFWGHVECPRSVHALRTSFSVHAGKRKCSLVFCTPNGLTLAPKGLLFGPLQDGPILANVVVTIISNYASA